MPGPFDIERGGERAEAFEHPAGDAWRGIAGGAVHGEAGGLVDSEQGSSSKRMGRSRPDGALSWRVSGTASNT